MLGSSFFDTIRSPLYKSNIVHEQCEYDSKKKEKPPK
jgi:hypothetical protein